MAALDQSELDDDVDASIDSCIHYNLGQKGCVPQIGGPLFVGVLIKRALVFWVLRPPDFWKLPSLWPISVIALS